MQNGIPVSNNCEFLIVCQCVLSYFGWSSDTVRGYWWRRACGGKEKKRNSAALKTYCTFSCPWEPLYTARVNFLLWQQRNANNLLCYYYLGFHRRCSYWKKAIHPTVWGRKLASGLARRCRAGSISTFQAQVVHYWIPTADASTASQRGVMHLCRHEHSRELGAFFSLFHLGLFVGSQDQSIKVFADWSLCSWSCLLAALLCIQCAGSVGGLCWQFLTRLFLKCVHKCPSSHEILTIFHFKLFCRMCCFSQEAVPGLQSSVFSAQEADGVTSQCLTIFLGLSLVQKCYFYGSFTFNNLTLRINNKMSLFPSSYLHTRLHTSLQAKAHLGCILRNCTQVCSCTSHPQTQHAPCNLWNGIFSTIGNITYSLTCPPLKPQMLFH